MPRSAPRLPLVSSLTGDWITDGAGADPRYWARQLREPVRFADGVGRLLEDAVARDARGRAGTAARRGLARSTRVRPPAGVVTLAGRRRPVVAAPGRGPALDRRSVDSTGRVPCRRQAAAVQLPTYPFERKRHWVDRAARRAASRARPVQHPAVDHESFTRTTMPATRDPAAARRPGVGCPGRSRAQRSSPTCRAWTRPASTRRVVPRARPRLALPHAGGTADPEDVRGEGLVPRAAGGRCRRSRRSRDPPRAASRPRPRPSRRRPSPSQPAPAARGRDRRTEAAAPGPSSR